MFLALENHGSFTHNLMPYPVSWTALKTTACFYDLYAKQYIRSTTSARRLGGTPARTRPGPWKHRHRSLKSSVHFNCACLNCAPGLHMRLYPKTVRLSSPKQGM